MGGDTICSGRAPALSPRPLGGTVLARLIATAAVVIPLMWATPAAAGPLDCNSIAECGWSLQIYQLGSAPPGEAQYSGSFAIEP